MTKVLKILNEVKKYFAKTTKKSIGKIIIPKGVISKSKVGKKYKIIIMYKNETLKCTLIIKG